MKAFLISLGLVIVVGGGYWLFMSQSNQPGDQSTTTTSQDTETTQTPTSNKTYTLAEIAKHSTATDCWMAIEGKVYNATPAISSHAGGDVILQGCGIDATKLFNQRPGEGTPHPAKVDPMLAQLYIGDLAK